MSELEDLSRRVAALETEVAALRGHVARGGADPSHLGTSAGRPAASLVGQAASHPGQGPAFTPPDAPGGAADPSRARVASPAGPVRPAGPGPLTLALRRLLGPGDIEFILGGNLLGKLGLFALVLAAGWFIKFAFDNHWINESGRIYVGLLVGFALVVTGMRLAGPRYRLLAGAVAGTGFAIVYIAFFGAFYFYSLIGRDESFVGLFILSAVLAFLSVRADSRMLYVFSLLGAFLAPLLLSSGENSYRFLFSYVSVVNVGFVAVSYYRPWRAVSPVVLLANVLLFSAWFAQNGARSSFSIPYAYLLVLSVGLLFREHVLFVRRRGRLLWDNILLSGLANVFFFIATIVLTRQFHPDWTGHLLLFGAGIQLLIRTAARRLVRAGGGGPSLSAADAHLGESVLMAAYLVWIFGALTDYFDGRLLTLAWIALAGALSLLGSHLRSGKIVLASVPVWVVALFRLLFLEPVPFDFVLLFNERFALFAAAALFLALSYLVQRKNPVHIAMRSFAFVGLGVLVIGTLLENREFVEDAHYRNLGYSYVLAGYAMLLLVPGFYFGRASARYSGMVLAGMVVAKLYLYDVWTMTLLVRIIAFATLGVALVLVSYYYQRFRERLFGKEPNSNQAGEG